MAAVSLFIRASEPPTRGLIGLIFYPKSNPVHYCPLTMELEKKSLWSGSIERSSEPSASLSRRLVYFAEILAFSDKKRIIEVVKATPLKSADLGICTCLDSFLRFLLGLLFSEFSRFKRINQIHPLSNFDLATPRPKSDAFFGRFTKISKAKLLVQTCISQANGNQHEHLVLQNLN